MKKKFLLFDGIFLARPVLWIPVWGFCAFGYWNALSVRGKFDLSSVWGVHHIYAFFWIFIFSMSVGAVYILNQIADYDVDRSNDGFPLLVHGGLSIGSAVIFASILSVLSVVVLLIKDIRLAYFPTTALLLGNLYSFKPAYLSGRPVADFLANAAGFGLIAFGFGWHLAGGNVLTSYFLLSCSPYFFLMCAGSISSTLPDMEGDKKFGKITTPVAIGASKAHITATCLIVLAGILSYITEDRLALTCSALSIPIYLIYCFDKRRIFMEATYKIGGAIIIVMALIVFPAIIIPSLVVSIGTWVYFRFRHNVSYPSLLPASHVADK